jgi:hypothetical protein
MVQRAQDRCYTFLSALTRQTRASETVSSLILRLLAIVVCGGGGGVIAWLVVSSLGGTGVGGAIAAAMIGMVLATLLWAGGVALIRALKVGR